MTSEKRGSILRRDLNDLIRDPAGRVSEAKTFSVIFKSAMIWSFVQHTEMILKDWTITSVFVITMIAPDLLKKWLAMRTGIALGEDNERVHQDRNSPGTPGRSVPVRRPLRDEQPEGG